MACMIRTRRRIAAEVIKLSVSSVTANSCRSPQRSQKSQKLPALKPVLIVAPPVGHRDAAVPFGRERTEALFLQRRDVGVVGVAQHIEMEMVACAGQLAQHGVEVADHALGRLVAHEDRDCG